MLRLLFAASLALAVAAAQDLPHTRAGLLAAAAHLDSLGPFDLWQHLPGESHFLPGVHTNDTQVLDRLAASNYPTDSLVPLQDDPDPKVRTLAIALLFNKDDSKLLPGIAQEIGDTAPSFDTLDQMSASAMTPPVRRPQTVADFTRAFIGLYVNRGEIYQWSGRPTFEEYWAIHKDLPYSFSSIRIKLEHMAGWSLPLSLQSKARVVDFLAYLAALPFPDRDLYLIWLQTTYTEPVLATGPSLSAAVKRLGRENVLRIAEGTVPSTDPDLQPTSDWGRYKLAVASILEHSSGVLQQADADRLEAVVKREREREAREHGESFVSPAYWITEARLRPAQADAILRPAIRANAPQGEFEEPTSFAAALLEIRGAPEIPFLRDFFFRGFNQESGVITALHPAARHLLELLLDDPRLADVHPGAMALALERFPGLSRDLLRAWFYTQTDYSISHMQDMPYFLTIAFRDGHGALLREILNDPRLAHLPVTILYALSDAVGRYPPPGGSRPSYSHWDELNAYFAANSTSQLSPQAVPGLVRFLHESAKYLSPN